MSSQKNKRPRALKTHDEMVGQWMDDPAFREEYDTLEEESQLLREMLHARKRAGLTQELEAVFSEKFKALSISV